MSAEQAARAWTALCALAYLGLGLWFLWDPSAVAMVGIETAEGTARAEVRAMYGGLELGIGAFLCACVLGSSTWVEAGLGLCAATLLALGSARGIGIALDATAPIMTKLLVFELSVGALSALGWGLLRRSKRSAPAGPDPSES